MEVDPPVAGCGVERDVVGPVFRDRDDRSCSQVAQQRVIGELERIGYFGHDVGVAELELPAPHIEIVFDYDQFEPVAAVAKDLAKEGIAVLDQHVRRDCVPFVEDQARCERLWRRRTQRREVLEEPTWQHVGIAKG